MKPQILVFLCIAFSALEAAAQKTVSAKNASRHIGETVKIIDKVFNGNKTMQANDITLDVGGQRPDQLLTVIIRNSDRSKFKGLPEIDFNGRNVIVTGKLVIYAGKPAIIASDPKQLKVVMEDNARTMMMPADRDSHY
jgi:hypothetical protein